MVSGGIMETGYGGVGATGCITVFGTTDHMVYSHAVSVILVIVVCVLALALVTGTVVG